MIINVLEKTDISNKWIVHHGVVYSIPDEFKDNKQLMMQSVRKNAETLRFASSRLRNDEELVLEAVNQSGSSIRWASNELQHNKQIALIAMHKSGALWAIKHWEDDEDIVLASVAHTGTSIQWASKRVRNNRAIALSAVKQSGIAFYWISDKLKGDPEIADIAARDYSEASKWIN